MKGSPPAVGPFGASGTRLPDALRAFAVPVRAGCASPHKASLAGVRLRPTIPARRDVGPAAAQEVGLPPPEECRA